MIIPYITFKEDVTDLEITVDIKIKTSPENKTVFCDRLTKMVDEMRDIENGKDVAGNKSDPYANLEIFRSTDGRT